MTRKRDTVELFVSIRQRRRGGWSARCKMIGCFWKTTAATEITVSKLWVTHFTEVHVAKWDAR